MIKIVREDVVTGSEIVSQIIQAIKDEWKTVSYYKELVLILKSQGLDTEVVEDIIKEELVHIGQLTTLMKKIDPTVEVGQIEVGEVEAEKQLDENRRGEIKMVHKYNFKPLKEGYSYGISTSELNNMRDRIDELIEAMDDAGQETIRPEPNTYGIGLPFIGTREGYIDLSDVYQYVEDPDESGEEYEEESLKETSKVLKYYPDTSTQIASGAISKAVEDLGGKKVRDSSGKYYYRASSESELEKAKKIISDYIDGKYSK